MRTKEEYFECFKNGYTTSSIARQFNVSQQVVCKFRRKYNAIYNQPNQVERKLESKAIEYIETEKGGDNPHIQDLLKGISIKYLEVYEKNSELERDKIGICRKVVESILEIKENHMRSKELALKEYHEKLSKIDELIKETIVKLEKNPEDQELMKELQKLEIEHDKVEKKLKDESMDIELKFLNRIIRPFSMIFKYQSPSLKQQ